MKNYLFLYITILSFILLSCNNAGNKEQAMPKPGTVLAKEEMPVTEDTLNKFTFAVSLIADSLVEQGIYDVTAVWGYNIAKTKFTMPKGGESIIPMMKKANKPYCYIIGFKTGKDTTFNEYFEVSGLKGTIKMIYTKSYTLE